MNRTLMDQYYPESRFGGFTDIDGTIAFYTRINAILRSSFTVLDVGCGRGAYQDDPILIRRNLRIMKGKVKRVIGIDVDETAKENRLIDEFRQIINEFWPIEDTSVDLAICDNVLEHIKEPPQFFSEIRRVMKNGGFVCIRTPNFWSYIAIIAKLIPKKYRQRVIISVQSDRQTQDVFPAYYKCNYIIKLRAMLKKYGFDSVVYGYEAEPSYLYFSSIAYRLGVLHQRYAPRFLKPAIFAFGQKT